MKRHKIVFSHRQALVLIDALEVAMSEWGDLTESEDWGRNYVKQIQIAENLSQRIKVMYWAEQNKLEASK